MKETLPSQPWIAHPATQRVMDVLEDAGGRDAARFVGGSVRDALLGLTVTDVDIATVLEPDRVLEAMEAAGIRTIAPGLSHGTVTALLEGRAFEITTLRRDVETDGRHARVAFTDDWRADATRRDFTINALYANRSGCIEDPTGKGLPDLRAGRIAFVGEARTRIREDALRILRYFRFLAWFGRGDPDPQAIAAVEVFREMLDRLSAERIQKEMLKLLAAEDPRRAVRLMAQTGVLTTLLPHADGLSRFDRLVEIESTLLFTTDPLLRLGALLHRDEGAARATAERLKLSNAERDRLIAALCRETPVSWMSPREVRRAIWRVGNQALRDRVMLAWAASSRSAATSQWRALLPMIDSWKPPAFPLGGDDAMAAGVPEGALVGAVLREVESWWVDHDFPTDRLAAIERLKAVAQGMVY